MAIQRNKTRSIKESVATAFSAVADLAPQGVATASTSLKAVGSIAELVYLYADSEVIDQRTENLKAKLNSLEMLKDYGIDQATIDAKKALIVEDYSQHL